MSKLKILLIILLVIAIILLAVFWYLASQANKQPAVVVPLVTEENQNNIQEPVTPDNSQNEPVVPESLITEEEKLKAQLEKIVSAFVERFGSFSNQSNYENLEDLMSLMTDNFKSWAENYIRQKRESGANTSVYYGMITKTMNVSVVDFSQEMGEAEFNVSTQRQESLGSVANSRVFYQDATVRLVEEGGLWKVTEMRWK